MKQTVGIGEEPLFCGDFSAGSTDLFVLTYRFQLAFRATNFEWTGFDAALGGSVFAASQYADEITKS